MAGIQLNSLLLLLLLVASSYLANAKSLRSRRLAEELQKKQAPKQHLTKRATNTSDFRFYNDDTARKPSPLIGSPKLRETSSI
jgi:hypothetical protein